MTISHKIYEVSLLKLNKTSRKRLVNAKKYIDRYVKKHCASQFSEDMTQNKELIHLLYTSSFHTACRSNILKLGLEYYSGLLLISQLPVSFYWQYRYHTYRICYQIKDLSGSANPLAIKKWLAKGYSVDDGLSWFRDSYERNISTKKALFRAPDLNNGEDES